MPELNLDKIDLGGFGLNQEEEQQTQLNANMTEAVKVNPDQHAEFTNLSKASGVPELAVKSDPDQVRNKLKLDGIDLDTMVTRAPRTASFASADVNSTIIAQEDIFDGVLESIENTFTGLGRSIGIGFDIQGKGLLLSGNEATSSRIHDLIPASSMPIGMEMDAMMLSEQFAANLGIETDEQLAAAKQEATDRLVGEVQALQKERQALTPDDLNIVQEGIRAGVESIAQMAPGVGLTVLSGGRAAPLLVTSGVQTFTASYGESRAEGLTPEEARWFAGIDAAIEVGTELLPTATLERILTGQSTGLKKEALKFVVQEMGTEQLATALQTLNSVAFGLDQELANAESVDEIIGIQLRRQAVTAVATVVAGGSQIAAATAVNKTVEKLVGTEQSKQSQGEAEQRAIDKLNEDSQKSKLKERDIESFKQFIRDADGENDTHVFIDGAQTSLYLQSKTREEIEADPALKTLDNAARESRATGADVAIPIDDFMGDVTGTDHYSQLREHMTLGEESITPFRQEQHRVETQSYIQTLMNEAQENASEYVEAQEIFTQVRDQLVDTGVVNAQNASTMAQIVPAWATAQANRTGRTVQQVYQDAGLVIEGPQTGELARLEGEQVLTQARESGFEGDLAVEASEWQQAVDKGLDMSPEAREGRAQEMGFDTGTVMYRGMDTDTPAMRTNEQGVVFVTPDAELASDPMFGGQEGGVVFPLYIKPDNLFDFNNTEHKDALLSRGRSPVFRAAANGDFRALQDPDVVQALKDEGYEGFRAVEAFGEESIAMFDPTSIRSVNAAFDPDFVESADLLAQQPVDTAPVPIASESDSAAIETGQPITFRYAHNKDSATAMFGIPDQDAPFERGFEPSGKYMVLVDENFAPFPGQNMEVGVLTLNNPLVIDMIDGKWKQTLSKLYDDLTGKELSKAIIADGYDGIVTKRDGFVDEIVDFTTFDESIALFQSGIAQPRNLAVVHNIREEGLAAAEDLGGLAAPSIAVTNVDIGGFTGFGEISLVADPSVLDDPTFKTFDADIYSARQPRSVDKLNSKKVRELTEKIEESATGTGLRPIYDIGEISDLDKDITFHYWLTTQGKAPKLRKMKPTPLSRASAGIPDNELAMDDSFKAAVAGIYKKQLDDMLGDNPTDEVREVLMDVAAGWFEVKIPDGVELRWLPDERGYAYFRGDEKITETHSRGNRSMSKRLAERLYTKELKDSGDFELDFTEPTQKLLADSAREVRKTREGFDQDKFKEDLAKKNQNNRLRADFKKWLSDTYGGLVEKKQLFKGYTPSGNRKYAEYTLNNVVREMTKTLQGGEGTNYGVASVRSRFANELSTKERVQASRDLLVTSDEMKEIKEESAKKFEEALEKLKPFYKYDSDGWGYGNDVAEAITEGASGIREAFGNSTEAREIIHDLGLYLSSLPTEYFESKVQRAMQLSEFDTAVVPKGASKETVESLRAHGLKIRRYDPKVEGDRNRVVASLNRLLFQEGDQPDAGTARGYYDPDNSIIRLTEAADLSTFLHEFAHFMYEMEVQQGSELNDSINNWYKRNSKEVAEEATGNLAGDYDPLKQGPRTTDQQTVTEDDVVAYLDEGTAGNSDKDLAIRRAVHEQFARGFETYLMEGTAPSIELRNAFRTFARWLAQIYQAFRGDLNVNLDDEMRQVFDRLLATEEQIAAAESRQRIEPLFTDAAMAGMTDDEFADYQKRQGKVKDVQTETLRDQMIKVLTRKTKRWWKEEKDDLVAEEMDRLSGERVYTTMDALRDGDIKVDHATVKEMVGEERTDKLGRKSVRIPDQLRGMTAKGQQGVHPDEAAAFLGYGSGSEMLNDLITATPIREAAEAAADSRMTERYGDPFTDGTIEQLADEAVQNEERGKLILHELKMLARGTNQQTLDRQTMKSVAEERIGQLSFREIHPGKYRKAEIRAAQESARMLAEGNKEGAAQAKQRQALNFYLGMAATEARNETTKIVDRMARYNKKKVREEIQKAEGGYWEQIVKILERFEFRKSATLASVDQINQDINTWAQERMDVEGDGLVLHNAVLNESYVTHWKNVAYSDLQGINDSVRNIEHVARYANKLTRMGEEIEYNQLVDRWTTSMDASVKTQFQSKRTDVAEGRKWGRWLMAQMTKIPFMASWLDGGERVGISHQVLVQPFTEAYNAELKLWEQAGKPVMDAIENRSKEDQKRHARKIFIPEINDHLYGHQILAVALNTGNEGNLRKMLLGEQWANPDNDAEINLDNPQLQAVLGNMTESDWNLVQLIWDQMDTLYPQLSEVHRRTTGLVPPKVEATPVETPYGTFRGGYYPVKYDPNRDHRAAQNEDKLNAETESMFSNNASIQASVNTGATNERTGYYAPIRLSLDVVPAHFQETIHYITHHDPVREVNKLIRDQRVANTIKEKLGPEEYAQLRPWLNDIAKDGRETPTKMFWDDILQRLRFGVTLGAMGFKASTGIIQISGLSNTISEVGLGPVYKATRSILGSTTTIKQAWDFAVENSQVLEHRAQTMDREIKNAMKNLESKRGILPAVQEASMKHIALIQTYMVDLPSWHAAYISGMEQWGDEARAFQYADWLIENVQGSGATKDLARIMRGQSETGRMFTMFMTFFSSLWNMERDLVKGAASGRYSPTNVAAKAMFLFTIPVLFDMLMRGEFSQEDEDDETAVQKMLTGVAMYPVQSVPFIRDVANAVTGDFGYNISPMQQIIEQGTQTIPEIVTRGFTDEEITKGQVKGATKFIGAAAGIPGTAQAWATGEHLHDVIVEGEELTMHQLLFGPERK